MLVHMSASKALVADDEPYVLALLSRILGKSGWEVATVASHDEVVSEIQQNPAQFQLMILDVEMPGVPVEETIARVRESGYEGGLYLSSGMPAGERKQELEKMTSGSFLTKPYDPHLLAKRVEEWKAIEA